MSWDSERLHAQVAQVDTLLGQLREHESEPGGRLGDQVVRALVDLYGEALARVVALAEQAGVGSRLLEDELVHHLLLVHDLHPHSAEQRVREVLDEITPQLAAKGASAEFDGLEDGVVRLTFDAEGCSSTTAQLAAEVEDLVRASAPEVERVETVEAAPKPVLVGVEELFSGGSEREARP